MDTGFKVNQMINQNNAMNMRMQQSSASSAPAAKADPRDADAY